MNIKTTFYLLFCFIGLYSCNDEVAQSYKSKPMAMGRLNDMVVIADNQLWEGMVGDTFRQYFEGAYPIMPNPEPMFDLRHFTAKELMAEPLRKELRTYVIVADLNDMESATSKMVRRDIGEERYLKAKTEGGLTTTVGRDKWARGQVVIYLFGKDETALKSTIREKFNAVAERVRKHDEEQLMASIYTVKGEHAGATAKIEERFGISLKIPGDYKVVVDDLDQNIYWLRRDDNESSGNIVLRSYDYTNQEQLTKENLIKLRDTYGKEYISGPTKGSYMVTNTEDLPLYEYTYDLEGLYTKELRGIWEMENDFMGGPFVSFAIYNQDSGKIIFIDTFIYAPGKQKRDMVQQMEFIIKQLTKAV